GSRTCSRKISTMKRTFLVPLTLGLLTAPSVLPAAPSVKITPQEDVVASVNNEPITREALIRRVLAYYGPTNLESMINQTLVRQSAEREKITVTDAEIEERVSRLRSMMRTPELFQQWLRESGLTEQHYRDQVRYTILTEKIVMKHSPNSESDLDRVRVRIILAQTEAQ